VCATTRKLILKSPPPIAVLFSHAHFRPAWRRQLQEKRELINLIRGDLDWIVMKALEKDRARRYEAANGLAGDIQRHLNNRAVEARPQPYRFLPPPPPLQKTEMRPSNPHCPEQCVRPLTPANRAP